MSPIPSIRAFALLLCLGLYAGASGLAFAADAPANATCLLCHAGAAGLSASVHGEMGLGCTDCHADVSADTIPHAVKPKSPQCASCHDKAVNDYAETVHARARKGGNTVAAECAHCHGAHDIRRSKDPGSRTHHVNLAATCSACHGDDATVSRGRLPGGNVGEKFRDSVHARALQGAARMAAPECTDCHGTHDILPKGDPRSTVSRRRVPETCGACHPSVLDAYSHGRHGKLRQAGNLSAPGCSDCHGAHAVQPTGTPAFQAAVIKECGSCHLARLAQLQDMLHNRVTAPGFARVATCASCHGAHNVDRLPMRPMRP